MEELKAQIRTTKTKLPQPNGPSDAIQLDFTENLAKFGKDLYFCIR